jgi:hypothetical protein
MLHRQLIVIVGEPQSGKSYVAEHIRARVVAAGATCTVVDNSGDAFSVHRLGKHVARLFERAAAGAPLTVVVDGCNEHPKARASLVAAVRERCAAAQVPDGGAAALCVCSAVFVDTPRLLREWLCACRPIMAAAPASKDETQPFDDAGAKPPTAAHVLAPLIGVAAPSCAEGFDVVSRHVPSVALPAAGQEALFVSVDDVFVRRAEASDVADPASWSPAPPMVQRIAEWLASGSQSVGDAPANAGDGLPPRVAVFVLLTPTGAALSSDLCSAAVEKSGVPPGEFLRRVLQSDDNRAAPLLRQCGPLSFALAGLSAQTVGAAHLTPSPLTVGGVGAIQQRLSLALHRSVVAVSGECSEHAAALCAATGMTLAPWDAWECGAVAHRCAVDDDSAAVQRFEMPAIFTLRSCEEAAVAASHLSTASVQLSHRVVLRCGAVPGGDDVCCDGTQRKFAPRETAAAPAALPVEGAPASAAQLPLSAARPRAELGRGELPAHILKSAARPAATGTRALAAASSAVAAAAHPADPNAPKKPLTPFFAFSADNRARVAAANPQVRASAHAKALGEAWRALPEAGRAVYTDAYQAGMAAHRAAMEAYVATPEYVAYVAQRAAAAAKLSRPTVADAITVAEPLGFGVFCERHRAELAAENPGMSRAKVAGALRERWAAMLPSEQDAYGEDDTAVVAARAAALLTGTVLAEELGGWRVDTDGVWVCDWDDAIDDVDVNNDDGGDDAEARPPPPARRDVVPKLGTVMLPALASDSNAGMMRAQSTHALLTQRSKSRVSDGSGTQKNASGTQKRSRQLGE